MISGDFTHCKTLEEFYEEIRNLHEKAHGVDYTLVHEAIRNRLRPDSRYLEFGVNQGATAAAALLVRPAAVSAVDIKLENFKPYMHLFTKFAVDYGTHFLAYEQNSINEGSGRISDVTYIDTDHRPSTLIKELVLHSKGTSEYIICHDTQANLDLYDVIHNFCKSHPWRIEEHCEQNVGYTVIARTDR